MEYRAARLRRYGIADGVPVIGTVSRLSEERRPFGPHMACSSLTARNGVRACTL
jgi:hypothetical protein